MTKALIAIAIIFLGFNSFSQIDSIDSRIDKTKVPTGVHKSKPVVKHTESNSKEFTISKKAGEKQILQNDAFYLDQISKIDQHINSINAKIAYVKSDELENANALNSGWYENMDNNLVRLNEKKKFFQAKLNN